METRKLVLVLASLALIVGPVMAADTLMVTTPSGFPWAPITVSWDKGTFNTFCVEWDRAIASGNKYAYTIDETVKYGGLGDGVLYDNTKKVYAAYLNGALDAVNPADIQQEIWYHQGADGVISFGGYAYGADKGILASLAATDYDGWKAIKVLNLWDIKTGADRQSVLVSVIPAPGAVLLAGIGTALVGLLRRRQSL